MVILIVDHNADEVHLFSEAMKCLDVSAQCIAAYNGQQALKILRSGVVPDYVFLDHTLQGMNAKETLKALRKDRSYKKIPVVVFGTMILEKEMNSLKASADHVLIRPPSFTDLCTALKSIITTGKQDA